MSTSHRPVGEASRAERGAPLPQVLAVLLSCAFMISPFVVRYPFTIDGQDAALRDRGLALALLFVTVCWARARTHKNAYVVGAAVLAALLVVEAFAYGGGPGGDLGAAPWNELVTGLLLLAVAAAGLRSKAS